MTKSPLDNIREMVGNDSVSTRKLEDALAELDPDLIRDWATAIDDLATALDNVRDQFEAWQYADGRDDKADARDELLANLDEVISAEGTIDMLDPIFELRLGGSIDERIRLAGVPRVASVSDHDIGYLIAVALGDVDDELSTDLTTAGRKAGKR